MCGCRKNKNLAEAPAAPRAVVTRGVVTRGVFTRAVVTPRTRGRPNTTHAPPPVPAQKREIISIHRRPGRRGVPVELRSTRLETLEVLDTGIWGPSLWRILHAAGEQPAKVSALATTIRALDGALPCPDCRGHYHTWLTSHPLTPTTDLRLWLLDLHNDVNARTGKGAWTAADLSATYGGVAVDVRGALTTLQGRIGVDGWRALVALV